MPHWHAYCPSVQRTDAINEWILNCLAEVHPSHELQPYEDENQWQTTCGGCLTQIKASKHVSLHTYSSAYYKKISEHPGALASVCVATKAQIPGKTQNVSDESGFYAKFDSKTHSWEAEAVAAVAAGISEDIDKELLKSLGLPKNQLVNSLPIEPYIKFSPTWSSLVEQAKKLAKNEDYEGVAKKAATLKKLVSEAQKQQSAATPLKQILSDLTAGGLAGELMPPYPVHSPLVHPILTKEWMGACIGCGQQHSWSQCPLIFKAAQTLVEPKSGEISHG
jgi:hypothetical protein